MNRSKGQASTQIHFGEVKTEIRPSSSVKAQDLPLDAMLIAAHTSLTSWIIDRTFDPESQGGKQEQLKAKVQDGQQDIAEIVINVPTTQTFSKSMYEQLLKETLVKVAQKAFRSFPSTYTPQQASSQAQGPLAQNIVPEALQQISRVKPAQLKTR